MFQHHQTLRWPNRGLRAGNDASWLSILVDTFEKISQSDLRAVPCDDHVVAAFKAHLARQVLSRGGQRPDFRLLH
jgi:hypothetical protein